MEEESNDNARLPAVVRSLGDVTLPSPLLASSQGTQDRHRGVEAARSIASPLFVLAFWSFWPPKAVADSQTLSFSVSFYKIHLGKNHSKST
jgi:hypothetical protein